jgi:hypothetical protein
MLMVMAAVAAYLPARRASRIDPMRVLRAEIVPRHGRSSTAAAS